MVWTKGKNIVKTLAFLFVLTVCLVLFGPYIIPQIQVGIFMFFSAEFWVLFFFIGAIWFVFGMLMWMRGYGRKGDSM